MTCIHSFSLRFRDTGDNNDNSYQPHACTCNVGTSSFKPYYELIGSQAGAILPPLSPALSGDSLGCHNLGDALGVPSG